MSISIIVQLSFIIISSILVFVLSFNKTKNKIIHRSYTMFDEFNYKFIKFCYDNKHACINGFRFQSPSEILDELKEIHRIASSWNSNWSHEIDPKIGETESFKKLIKSGNASRSNSGRLHIPKETLNELEKIIYDIEINEISENELEEIEEIKQMRF